MDQITLQVDVDEARDRVIGEVSRYLAEYFDARDDFLDVDRASERLNAALEEYVAAFNDLKSFNDIAPKSRFFLPRIRG